MEPIQERPMELSVTEEYSELKTRVHERLLNTLDLSLIETLEQDRLRKEIRRTIEVILSEDRQTVPLNFEEKEQFCSQVVDEVLGLGPIEPYMRDPTVTDILVNTHSKVYVERHGKLQVTGARFKDEAHLRKIIDRIVSAVGRHIDEACPMVDARLPDGSRVNAICTAAGHRWGLSLDPTLRG